MNAERVWIDHNTFTDEPRIDKLFPPVFDYPFDEATQKVQHHDGQVDVTLLSTKVTISNNVFKLHDKTNLLGGSDRAGLIPGYGPGVIDVTFHGNYYNNIVQRSPRVRFGRVHVYNNYYEVDRRPEADYRITDPWILGTASKLVTENNLFDITNTNTNLHRIITYSSTNANRDLCVAAGYTLEECGTYYFNQGTWVNMIRTVPPLAELLREVDVFEVARLRALEVSPNSVELQMLDPDDPDVFWFPSQTYDYELAPVSTDEERAALRAAVRFNAGAGKL